jgi:CheY-like chemotaxis protein
MGRILLVDDDPSWRALYRLALEDRHEIREAAHAVAALAAARDAPPDVMVLDYQLPGISGAELVAALRAEGFTTPVVLCTAHPGPARAADYAAVLLKSTDLRLLRRTIDRTLARESWQDPPRAA